MEWLMSFILYIVIAAVCAYIGDFLVPGTIPGGFLLAAVFGVIGAWIGGSLMGPLGPSLAGVHVVPAILGSAILVFCVNLVSRKFARRM
jgi:uncharacterized membrane protein YeaQ/YmgE (transglycosylase-associated protein family)